MRPPEADQLLRATDSDSHRAVFRAVLRNADLFKRALEVYSKCGCRDVQMEIGPSGIVLLDVEQENMMLKLEIDAERDCASYETSSEQVVVGVSVSYSFEILRHANKSDQLVLSVLEAVDGSAEIGLEKVLRFEIPGKNVTEQNTMRVRVAPQIQCSLPEPQRVPVVVSTDNFRKIQKTMNKAKNSEFWLVRKNNVLYALKEMESMYTTKLRFDCAGGAGYEEVECGMRCSANTFANLEKLTSQGKVVRVFLEDTVMKDESGEERMPLVMKTDVEKLGCFSVYLFNRAA